jgi:hypothetical protein
LQKKNLAPLRYAIGMLEYRNTGMLGFYSILLKNMKIHETSLSWNEKNINKGRKNICREIEKTDPENP